MRRPYVLAYALWVLGLAGIVLVDWGLRLWVGPADGLGMAEPLWFAAHGLLALLCLRLLLAALAARPLAGKLGHLALAVLVGGVVYLAMILLYVTGTGIDAL